MFRRILLTIVLMGTGVAAWSQRLTIGTDAAEWLGFGTMNLDASAAVSRNISLHVGASLNPWTFKEGKPDEQFQMRRLSYNAGLRWWPWHIYSGWWAGSDVMYIIYNEGGILSREAEEGQALGGSAWGGYSVMRSDRWNLDIGAGIRGGWKKYTVYTCPICGVKTDSGEKGFLVPDARIAVQWIF